MTAELTNPVLSICIATYNRGAFIGATLDSILAQMEPSVEIVVVDGASPDNTPQVLAQYLSLYPDIHYFRELENSGVDRDYDKAVGYATGNYCWLMSDDDLLTSGAIRKVLNAIEGGDRDLIVVNAELRNTDLSEVLDARRLHVTADLEYGKADSETFFSNTASYLSFIACVVIKRNLWLTRNRSNYFGTFFIHVGVIFQDPPLENILIIAEPLIVIRHGNSMWTPRSFEIWIFKWQQLIWSFSSYSESARALVSHREPWRKFRTLLYGRAMGSYSITEFNKLVSGRTSGLEKWMAYIAAVFPTALANLIAVCYFVLMQRSARLALYDLSRARSSTLVSRLLVRAFGI
jgi:abequosyltransferase